MKDELNLLLILYSRNNGDYIPDYEFDNLLTSLESHIKSLLKKQRENCAETYFEKETETEGHASANIEHFITNAPEPVK